LVTTSRRPSHKVRIIGRELAAVLPHAEYVTRGKKSVEETAYLAYTLGSSKLIIIGVSHGGPGSLSVLRTGKDWDWIARHPIVGASLYRELAKTKLRRGKTSKLVIKADNPGAAEYFRELFTEEHLVDEEEDKISTLHISTHGEYTKLLFHREDLPLPGPMLKLKTGLEKSWRRS